MNPFNHPHQRRCFSKSNSWMALLIMLYMSFSSNTLAQDRTITGRVTSAEDNASVAGVNILCKGTALGTITDPDGNYSLIVPSVVRVLVFSSIGLKTREVEIGEMSIINISLSADVTQLFEVVVTGTGVPVEKRKLAVAVESVKSEDLPIVPTASIDQALVGKVPGALVLGGNGQPGAQIGILLRGVNSVNRGTKPMVLVNGVEMGVSDLNTLDPSSVERIEVVQGAAAASMYGAQGANGVIHIFTRQGQKGSLAVDFSSNLSTTEWLNTGNVSKARYHSFLTNSTNDVIGASGELLTQDPQTLTFNENVVWSPLNPATVTNKSYDRNLIYYDHMKEFFVRAYAISNNLSIGGGGDRHDFNLTISNIHHESNFVADGYNDRTNLIANIGVTLAPSLNLRSVSQLAYTKNTIHLYNKQFFGNGVNYFGMLSTRPFVDYRKKDTEGNYGIHFGDAAGSNSWNPFYTDQYSRTRDNTTDFVQSFEIDYKPIRFLNFNAKYGLNHQNQEIRHGVQNQSENANLQANQNYYDGWFNSDPTGEISTFEYSRTSQNFIATAIGKIDFREDLKSRLPLLSITQIVFDYRDRNTHDYVVSSLGLPLVPPLTANQASEYKVQRDYTTEFVTYGYLFNQRFELGEYAGVSGGFRSDYSSAFGSGSTPFTFPRADAFLRISGFDFWDRSGLSKIIFEWKLRAAYGKAGIQPHAFDRFPTLSTRTLGSTNAYFMGANQSNPELDVEVSTEFEAGTDLVVELLKGNWLRQINLSFTYWTRQTANAIFLVDAPPSTGIGRYINNAFSLESHGIQASLNTPVVRSKKVRWTLTVNLGTQTSRVASIIGNTEIVIGPWVMKPGEEVGQLNGFMLLRDLQAIDPNTGQPHIPFVEQNKYEVASNGWVVNKDTKRPYVTPNRYTLGSAFPDFNSAFINDFTIGKHFSAGIQVDWIKGGNIYNGTKSLMYRDGIHNDYTKEFEVNGETGAWSAFYNGLYNAVVANGIKNYFYEDGTFARLRNAYMAYDFNHLLHNKLRRLQLVISGRNLLTRTKYTGMDPEISSYNPNGVLTQRIDNFSLPNFRAYQISLNIGF